MLTNKKLPTNVLCPMCMTSMNDVLMKPMKKPEQQPHVLLLADKTAARTITHRAIGTCDHHGIQSTKV